MKDDLEPVFEPAEVTLVRDVEESCAEAACYARVPELVGVQDDHEESQWITFLLDVADAHSGLVNAENSVEVDGIGWIEDTHGGAVYVPYC